MGNAFAKYEDVAAAALSSDATKEINIYVNPKFFLEQLPNDAEATHISALHLDKMTAAQYVIQGNEAHPLILRVPFKNTNVLGHFSIINNENVVGPFQGSL